jgi:lipoprotein-releasing system permease protein
MNFPFYIARRYLFAKKSHNIINIISGISVIGMATGVMALVVILSVFNGFDELIRSMMSSFDADLKVELVEGKTFPDTLAELQPLRKHESIAVFSEVLEENAIFKYRGKQHIGVMKGVSRNYAEQTGVDSMVVAGEFLLWRGSQPLAVIGQGVAYYLNANLEHFDPLEIFLPRRGRQHGITSASAFSSKLIMPSGIFAIEQEFDTQYILVPVEFSRTLLSYKNEVTSIELKVNKGYNHKKVQQEVQAIVGERFRVLNRFQQNESLYKTMKTEKVAIALILGLILVIASFNIIGSLSMLIIDKRKDVETLRSLGADNSLIQKIFLVEGFLVSLAGTVLGTVFGLLICWVQIYFEPVKLRGIGTFIIDAYPVDVQFLDIAIILVLVLMLGYLAARFPVRIITRRIFSQEEKAHD